MGKNNLFPAFVGINLFLTMRKQKNMIHPAFRVFNLEELLISLMIVNMINPQENLKKVRLLPREIV